jgi:hypothetical protein
LVRCRQHGSPEWQAAIPALMLVAAKGGPTMLPRIAVLPESPQAAVTTENIRGCQWAEQ